MFVAAPAVAVVVVVVVSGGGGAAAASQELDKSKESPPKYDVVCRTLLETDSALNEPDRGFNPVT